MSTRGDILRRAAQVEPDAVPEPWRVSDDEEALATVSDREHYRKNLVTLPDGAGEVPAYVWDFPRTPTIPDEVREEWTRGSAGRVLNAQGKYVSRGSDVPRLSYDGEEPGLLVEAAGRTNQQTYSSNFSQWTDFSSSFGTSVIRGQTAYVGGGDGTDSSRWVQGAGSMPSGEFIAYAITEKKDVDVVGWGVKDTTAGGTTDFIAATYRFSTDSLQIHEEKNGTIKEVNSRILGEGPNGGALVHLTMRLTGTQGNSRSGVILPDMGSGISGNDSLWHHFQIEEAPNASSPIVTTSSAKTRAGDNYAIFEGGQPPWWNPNEGTFFAEYTDRRSNQQKSTFLHNGSSNQIIGISGGGLIVTKDGAGTISAGSVNPFSKDKIAVSITKSGMNQSVNGSSVSGSHNGSLLSISSLGIDVFDNLIGSIGEITYYPRALPESTLNRITS